MGAWMELRSKSISGQLEFCANELLTSFGFRTVGVLINTIPVPASMPDEMTMRTLLTNMQEFANAAMPYSHNSQTDHHRWAGMPPGEALFDMVFAYENYPDAGADISAPF